MRRELLPPEINFRDLGTIAVRLRLERVDAIGVGVLFFRETVAGAVHGSVDVRGTGMPHDAATRLGGAHRLYF